MRRLLAYFVNPENVLMAKTSSADVSDLILQLQNGLLSLLILTGLHLFSNNKAKRRFSRYTNMYHTGFHSQNFTQFL